MAHQTFHNRTTSDFICKLSRKIFLALILATLAFNSSAQNMRGLYVNGFNSILGNAVSEENLLNYAQNNGYNYLCLYSLASLNLTSSTVKSQLASFIHRAKTQYGVHQVGAAGEIYSFFSSYILPFNQSRNVATEKFDVLNFEFEFWINSTIANQYCAKYLTPGGYSCDSAGAFAFAKTQFTLIDNAASANGMISEVYFGWPNKGQMQWYAQRADRILLHAYRTSDIDIYTYTRNRLMDIASVNRVIDVMIIFSSESAYMGPWLQNNSITQPYETYAEDFAAEIGTWKSYINLQGYQWFKYSLMPPTSTTTVVTASITPGGPLSFCQGGNVVLTANSGTSQTYQWTKNTVNISGATGISYTATASGEYAVKVSKAGVTATSTTVSVNVQNSIPAPVITLDGSPTLCQGSSVTLTSSSETGNLWSNNATTKSITVNSAGSYSVSVSQGLCTATSAPVAITMAAAVPVPTITASGPVSFCTGGNVTLTSSSATGNLWSMGATGQSITVSTSGNYTVTVLSGSCAATSSPTVVSETTTPPVPTITSGGSTNICPGTGVVLTSSLASTGGYLWSNGATTRSIVAQTAGSYWVRTGTTSCFAQSSAKSVTLKSAPATPVISTSGPTHLTNGASVTLTSSTASAYSWVHGSTKKSTTVSTAGVYRVTVTGTNGCKSTSADKIITSSTCTPPAVPTITSSKPNNVIEEGSSLTLTASDAGGWLWSTGATTKSITVSAAGTYTVRAYNAGYCFSTSKPVTVYMINSGARLIDEIFESPESSPVQLTLFPNPAYEDFKVSFTSLQNEKCQVNVYDLSGRILMSHDIEAQEGPNTVELKTGTLPPAMYVLTVSGQVTFGMVRFNVVQ